MIVDRVALRLLTFPKSGRALAILPREIAEHGYMDMEIDDDKEGSFIRTLREKINNVSVRIETKV